MRCLMSSIHVDLRNLRWDKWTPTDPATLAEVEEREEEEDQKRSKEFEESNPDFCKQMVDDMKARSEARCVMLD